MRAITLLVLVALALAALASPCVYAGDIAGKVIAKKKKYLPNTIVYVDSVKGEFKPPEKHEVMDQKNLVFIPHVLPVLAGTTVDFLNSDNVAHNVFTPDASAEKFNLGTWPTGEIRSYKFEKRCDKVCDAVMLCNVHPEMESFVVIMENPYFTTVDEDGNFLIKDVPAGKYSLNVWHPNRKAESQSVVVSENDSLNVEFELKRK